MKKSIILIVLFSMATFLNLNAATHTDHDELYKTIILINGAPFLVELDHNGKVIHNYIMVSDYFQSKESHENLVIKATHEFDEEIAEMAGNTFIALKKQNKIIDYRDLFIGTTAVFYNLEIATLNIDHFGNIPNIKIIVNTSKI